MVALSCTAWNEPPPHRAGRVIGQTRGMSDGMNPQAQEHPRVLVVAPDGIATSAGDQDESGGRERPVTEMVEQPAKAMRTGNTIRRLLGAVKESPQCAQ